MDIKKDLKGTGGVVPPKKETETPKPEGQEYKFTISANLKSLEIEKVNAKITKTKEVLETTPDFLKDAIKTQLIKLEYEKTSLETDSNPVLINRIAFCNFINSLPKGLLGEGTIVINLKDDGYTIAIADARHKSNGNGNIPDWASYGYNFTAQSVCDKLGLYVGNASANAVLYSHAKKSGKTVQELVALVAQVK